MSTAGSQPVDQPEDLRVPVADGVSLQVLAWRPASRGSGRAAPFVLLHGIASNARVWDAVAAQLANAGHLAYAVDFRGHGRSDKPESGYDVGTLADDLIALVDRVGLDRPVLAGHSLGANVILAAAARRPGLAGAVVLVEGGLVDARQQFATLEECLARVALPPVKGTPAPRLEGYFRHVNPSWSDVRVAATMACLEVLPDGSVEWWLTPERRDALARSLWEQRVEALWPAVAVPLVALVADTGDPTWTAAKREADGALRRALPDARIEWIAAEHDVHAQHPDETAKLLLEVAASAA